MEGLGLAVATQVKLTFSGLTTVLLNGVPVMTGATKGKV